MLSVAKHAAFLAVQLTWGLPQTLVGALMYAFVPGEKGGRFRCAFVNRWRFGRGLSLGPFIFVPGTGGRVSRARRLQAAAYDEGLLVHEYGHCIQSLIFGPLYLPLFAVPSMIWAGAPALGRLRSARSYSYYRFYTEKLANWLGERTVGKEPLRR